MTTVTATLHTPAGEHVTDLPRLNRWWWADPKNEPGAGEVVVRADDLAVQAETMTVDGEPVTVDATLVLIGHDWAEQHYQIRLATEAGEVFAFRIDPPTSTETIVAAGKPPMLHLAGQGVGAILDRVPILPETGLGYAPPDRAFNWISKHFVPWGDVFWTSPATHGTVAAPANEPWSQLEGWPDIATHAEWMQAGTSTPDAPAYVYPAMYSYYRATLVLTEALDVGVYATADDEIDVYLAGDLLVRTEGTMQWRQTHTTENGLHLAAGSHQIAIRARNLERPTGTYAPDSPAGVIVAVCELNASGEPVDVLLVSQGSGWSAVGDPPHPPGMTPGRKYRLIVEEAQARGEIPAVTIDSFNDDEATPRTGFAIGEEWLDNTDWRVPHGTTALNALMADAAGVVDWHMTPDLDLRLWGKDRRGIDRTAGDAPVRLTVKDVQSMTVGPPRPMVNALVYETAEGIYAEVRDDLSISRHGRFADFVQLGEHDLEESAKAVAARMLAERAKSTRTADATLHLDARYIPYEHFDVGDTVELPEGTGFAPWEVLVVACEPGPDGRARWKLQLRREVE